MKVCKGCAYNIFALKKNNILSGKVFDELIAGHLNHHQYDYFDKLLLHPPKSLIECYNRLNDTNSPPEYLAISYTVNKL